MKRFVCLLVAVVSLLVTERSYASHAMGTDITYQCLGNNQYRVTVAFYRDCSGIIPPPSVDVDYYSSSCNITAGSLSKTLALDNALSGEVSPLCPADLPRSTCNGGTLPGVERYVYTGIITLPLACNDWIISFSECCRNSNITNLVSAASYNLFAYARINNTGGICNNSPVFTTLPVPYICANTLFNYNHGAVDPDSDSLVYQMIQPNDDYQVPIPYDGSFTVNYPMSTTTSTFQFNSATGQISLTPDVLQYAVVTVQVEEYRNGQIVGSTMRDMQIVVLDPSECANTPPVVTAAIANISGGGLIDSSTIQMCPGTPLSFEMVLTDSNGDNINLSSNASTAVPGSSFSVIGNGSTITGRFSWVPALADTGFHPFQVTYSDDGCPVSTPQTVTYVVFVFDRVVASADQVYCGDSIQLNAYGGSTFIWSPADGLSATNIENPKAAPTVPTMYYVTSDCNRTDSVFVDVQPPYTLDAGRDTTICLNAVAQLHAAVNPATYGPYSYSWTPTLGLDDPNISNPTAKPTMTTAYALTSFSARGCIRQDTVIVNISGVAPSVTAVAEPSKVCVGETTQLELTVRPSSCTTTTLPCNGTSVDYITGAGTQQTSASLRGSPYRGRYEDERVQYLYRASELNALGITGGTITQIAFNVATKRSTVPYNNFTIKIGCTSLAFLPGFDSGLTTVYGPTAYTTSSGWNTHVLTSSYEWDGVSNLLVQVCFDNNTLFNSLDDDVFFTNTAFSSVAYNYDDLATGCNLTNSDTVKFRPNTRFSVCSRSLNNAVIDWSLSFGNSILSDSSIFNPTAQVFGTTRYIANVSLGGCAGQGPVTIIVDTAFTVTAESDTSLCRAEPVQLNASGAGQPSYIYLSCGTNGTVAGASVNYQIGNSSGLTPSPNPYHGNNHDSRMQMLFKRSELEAVSMKRGVITSIAFNVAYKASTAPFKEFSIKMGCTDRELIGNLFEPNLPVVFTPKNVTTTSGWNVHNFDNYFDWDGSSNIIVELCFNNSGPALDDIITYSLTAFISVIDTSADYSTGCNLPTPRVGGSYKRPNVIFGASPPPLATFSYLWSPPNTLSSDTTQNPVANPVTTTTYTVMMTDGICISTDSVNIDFYTSFDVNVYGTNIGCNGIFDGNAVSVPVGGVTPYNFVWNTGRTISGVLTDTLYNLNAGTYQITVVDNNGCDATDSVTITVPPPLLIDNVDVRNVSCFNGNNGSAFAIGLGGTLPHTFLWSSGDSTALATQLAEGTYEVTLTDGGGCTVSDMAIITQPTPISSSTNATDATCYGETDGIASVSVSGGTPPYTYKWSDNQSGSTAMGLSAGMHEVRVTDDSLCVHLDTATVSQPDSFSIIATASDVSCFGGSDGMAMASVMGDTMNYSFYWDVVPPQTTSTATGLAAGRISFSVIDSFGCEIPSTIVIEGPDQIILSTNAEDVTCFGYADGSASVSADMGGAPPFRYLWSNSFMNSSITALTTGDYYVTVTDINDCPEYDTVNVSQPDLIVIRDSIIDATCYGYDDGRILVTISGGTPSFSYLWSDGQVTPIAGSLPQGTYALTITDQNGCMDSLSGIILREPAEVLFGNIDITKTCVDQSVGTIVVSSNGGTAPYQYALDNSITQSNPEFTGLAEGQYTIKVIDDNGCSVDSVVTVIPYDTIYVAFDTAEIQINLGDEITLNPVIQPYDPSYQIQWSPTTGLSCYNNCQNPVASPSVPTSYLLTVTDHPCSYSAEIVVNVSNNLVFNVPNAFTPNGDGVNDVLYVYGIRISSLVFQVFDRWGEKVFESRDMGTGWDGSFKGKMLGPGVFVYYAEAVFEDGQHKQIKGGTTILK